MCNALGEGKQGRIKKFELVKATINDHNSDIYMYSFFSAEMAWAVALTRWMLVLPQKARTEVSSDYAGGALARLVSSWCKRDVQDEKQTSQFILVLQNKKMAAMEEPILSRLNRLDNILKQLEDIKSLDHSPKSSCASTFSSGTLTSDGQASSVDYSPKSLEKHCLPINEVILEVKRKGTLIERLVHVEDRVFKICMQFEEELEAEKHRDETPSAEKNSPKKVLKKMLKTCVGGGHGKHKIKD
ncbi:unnamed protein product [Fraxinus pennsylvanica]|uniref:Uncharacterized protein n=1 Tax=Fraxinus pennsylvanica TaxID=56036 RepID=A0AAD1ZHC0_9LAMI|nr:unnamed protein product [Fraxinus pennsylvanica]